LIFALDLQQVRDLLEDPGDVDVIHRAPGSPRLRSSVAASRMRRRTLVLDTRGCGSGHSLCFQGAT
jgi:hypothetical protein